MKVAFCNNNIGGFYNFRKDVVEHLYKKGCEIILLYPECEDNIERREKLSEFCRCIPVNMKPNGQNPLNDIPAFFQIRQIYKSERPDIVFNYTVKPNIYSSIAAKSLGIPVVSMMAGLGYAFDGNSLKKKMARLLYRCGLNACDKVIMLNLDNYNTIVERYVNRKKLVLFEGGEGVNMECYPYKENKFDEIHFLMIARLMFDKGYQQFVDAARIVKQEFPEVHFELLGGLCLDSPTRVPKEILDRDIAEGNIEYLGVTDDVPSVVLREGTVVVVASYYMEGMNRALMEACSMGRPIITTDMPGCKEMVDDGETGYCIEPKSAEALAKACKKFIKLGETDKEAMARASYVKCKSQFDVKDVLMRYDAIIEELVKS